MEEAADVFVDFGATDGAEGSKTHVLEQRYGWNGMLAGPARCWKDALLRNRRAHIELACVAETSGCMIPLYAKGVFSGMRKNISARSRLKRLTKPQHFHEVPTISMMDLLKKHNAPKVIDYLSLDTEGSALEIPSAFGFSAYQFGTITCERNYKPDREKLFELLTAHGCSRVLQSISETDDWYV